MKGKVKCPLVQALSLCTGCTAHRGSRGIALLFHDHGTRKGWGVSVTPRPLFTPGKDPVPIVQEAGWAPGPVWTGAENLAPPTGFDPRTVQVAASRWTDYATRPINASVAQRKLFFKSYRRWYIYSYRRALRGAKHGNVTFCLVGCEFRRTARLNCHIADGRQINYIQQSPCWGANGYSAT